jgi:peptidyl-Lys metalloendopeptidase
LHMGILSFLLPVLLYSFYCSSEKAMYNLRQEQILRYTLSAAPSYTVGQPIEMTFTLENVSADTLFILTWYTPLEGLKGNIFTVMRDSTEIRYRGRMVKRGQPDQKDYVRLAPGDKTEKQIDLSRGYDLSIPGRYSVAFDRQIYDVVKAPAKIPRLMADHTPVRATGNTVILEIVGH